MYEFIHSPSRSHGISYCKFAHAPLGEKRSCVHTPTCRFNIRTRSSSYNNISSIALQGNAQAYLWINKRRNWPILVSEIGTKEAIWISCEGSDMKTAKTCLLWTLTTADVGLCGVFGRMRQNRVSMQAAVSSTWKYVQGGSGGGGWNWEY